MSIESAHEWAQSLTAADLEDLLRVVRNKRRRCRVADFDDREFDTARILEAFRDRAKPGIPKGARRKAKSFLGKSTNRWDPHREYRAHLKIEQACISILRHAGLLVYDKQIRRLVAVIPPGIAYGNHRGDAPHEGDPR